MVTLLDADPTRDMRELPSWMVTGAGPGRLKLIVFWPAFQFDSVSAARNVHWPVESAQIPSPLVASGVSAVLVTTKVRLPGGQWLREGARSALGGGVAGCRAGGVNRLHGR